MRDPLRQLEKSNKRALKKKTELFLEGKILSFKFSQRLSCVAYNIIYNMLFFISSLEYLVSQSQTNLCICLMKLPSAILFVLLK